MVFVVFVALRVGISRLFTLRLCWEGWCFVAGFGCGYVFGGDWLSGVLIVLCIHILLLDACLRGVVLFSFDDWMFAVIVLFAFCCCLGAAVICLCLCCCYWVVNLVVWF